MQKAYTYLQAKIPGWTPSEGQLDTMMIEAIGGEAADIGTLTSEVPKTIFRYWGAKLFGVIPKDATNATCTATVYAVDTLGYTVPAGMQVGVYDDFNNLVPFTVLQDRSIPAPTTSVSVTLIAEAAGSASSGLGAISGPMQLIDILSWVDHITQNTVTSGGEDAESDDDYLSRLSTKLQTVTPTPILAQDFAILATDVEGVQRAAAIDGYDPDSVTFGNARTVCLVSLDSTGAPVGSTIKTNVNDYLTSLRETNFIVKSADASVNQVDVTCAVISTFGYNLTDVQTRVTAAISNYLDPAQWGIAASDDPNDPVTFINDNIISYLSLANVILNTAGVDHINNLILGAHGGSLAAADYTMTGVCPIPNVGTLTVTVPS
jgi:uncharacterized phage protein gp47/JayE